MGNRLERPSSGTIPTTPGVYMFKGPGGRVLYVGKAKSLRARLSNYFGPELHPRTGAMLEAATSVEWIITDSEVEALHLEVSLIKEYRPRYNVRYRDDKSYPYLAVTLDEDFPRARVMRGRKRKGVKYYGPFAHAYAIRETLDLLLRTFPVRTCSQGVFDRCHRRGKPCLLFHIERCSGPCVGAVDAAGHRAIVMELCDFLDGNTKPILDRLESAMKEAAGEEEFEAAARYRDQLQQVRKAIERQQMVSARNEDLDVIGLEEDDLEAAFQVFFVRKGRVTGRKGFIVDKVEDLDRAALLSGFMETLYSDNEIPRRVLVPEEPSGEAVLREWLEEKRNGPVRIDVPKRGELRALLETVTENAVQSFKQHRLKRASDFAARSRQLRQLQKALGMDEAPLRIECFDISNTGPTEAVGSMVVFEDGSPKRSDYRRFAIKDGTGQDDFANMGEVVRRRFSRYLEDRSSTEPTARRFAYPPNLVVIDGGKGQLRRAVEAMDELGIDDVTTVSLAKRMEEVFVPDRSDPIVIPRGSEALYLLQQIRDEAHRFAVEYHRKRRSKAMTRSVLDEVHGLGPARKKKLLKRFGSVKKMREATVEELTDISGIPRSVAEGVYGVLHGGVTTASQREEAS